MRLTGLRPVRFIAVLTVTGPFLGFAANAYAKLDLGVSSTSYLGEGAPGRNNSFSTLDLELDTKTKASLIDSRALVQAEIGLNNSEYRFIEFPELYLATSRKLTGNAQTTLGRKLVAWSALDDNWGSGAFESRFRWDYIHPQEVGLLGLYQEVDAGPVKMTAFYSPIFIPDRGAPLDFTNGRVHSISPWAVNPPYEIQVRNTTVPVNYGAEIPSVGNIIRQNSFAGQIRYDQGKYGFWTAGSYAYKPMNELLMSYEANLTGSAANVTLFPRVAYHHVASLDIGERGKTMSATISGIADLPTDDATDLGTLRTSQQVGDLYLLSPNFTVSPFGVGRGTFSLTYLRVFGVDPPDTGYLADGTSEFDSRYPFKSAFLFSAELPTWRRLSANFRLLYDMQNPGTIASWMFTYVPQRDWKLFLATDILSSFTGDNAEGTDFIHRYRENDRVTGGVAYVF
jgi:hypothetical protein